MLETFFRIHQFLLEHTQAPVRRALMDEIDWKQRLIGIKGSRGVGKTTFLLQYAKENFGLRDKRCLYINMNNFYFQGKTLFQFAQEFQQAGGQVLLIDQVFKQPDWSHELRLIYNRIPRLRVVFTGSSVMRLKDENPELNGIVDSYNLRGFSFREYLNLKTGENFKAYSIREIQNRHERIAQEVLAKVDPLEHFRNYLHHGYYPFFLENSNFSENLLKTMNMMIEVDILLIKQIDLKYLSKIKKLLYLLATGGTGAPNVSQLASDMQTSRATVMNYIKYLSDARLLNMIYRHGEEFPKKPSGLYLHNTNLMYAMTPGKTDEETLMETFFQNALWGRHKVEAGDRSSTFIVDGKQRFRICLEHPKRKNTDVLYALSNIAEGAEQEIPIWVYGFLY
ncbi:MAG: ATP-binding protein [Bacteroidaceae bacterium]|nr:ATP-binding protein [Bacteroidaceae bacterium]MBR1902341.1 ATP-binding protein [Bacteroidaceae bacterium]